MRPHFISVLQALLVVFLWATSWVFVKIGLHDIPPITFAGLRYFLAFICLSVVLFFKGAKREIRTLTPRSWTQLILLGIFFYAGTQGAIFVALAYLPAVTVNLLWSFSSVIIALFGALWLSEKPTWLQWGGIILAVVGALIYFYPVIITKNQYIGVIVALAGILANAISSIMGRGINRSEKHTPLVVTVISMGVGSLVLLTTGILLEKTHSTGYHPAKRTDHSLAGSGQHSLRIHPMEPHSAHSDRHGVQHHQWHHADLDCDICCHTFGREYFRQRTHWAYNHRHRHVDRPIEKSAQCQNCLIQILQKSPASLRDFFAVTLFTDDRQHDAAHTILPGM